MMRSLAMSHVVVAVTLSGATPLIASTFENHLASPIMVSPTQIHQVKETKTDFSLGYSMATDSNKSASTTSESSNVATDVFAGGVFNIKSIGIIAGIAAEFKTMSQKLDEKSSMDGSQVILTPQAAYAIGPVIIGGAFDIIQKSAKPEDSEEMKADYVQFKPALAYANDSLEAGIVYASPTRKEDEDTLKVLEPAQVTLHGRYALTTDLAIGGVATNSNYKAIDEEAYSDQLLLKGTAEYLVKNLKIEGSLGYSSAYYENKEEDLNEENIANVSVGAAGDYALNSMTSLGASATYEFGSDSNQTLEVANNAMSVALRGNVKF